MQELVMPKVSLGDDDEPMVLLSWLVTAGESFDEGDPVVEVETSKANMEVEAPFGGVMTDVAREVGSSVVPGDVLAFIAGPGEAPSPDELASLRARIGTAPAGATPAVGSAPAADSPGPAADGESAEPTELGDPVEPVPSVEPVAVRDDTATSAPAAALISDDFDGPGAFSGLPPAVRRGLVRRRADDEGGVPAQESGERLPLSRHRRALASLMTKSASIPQFSVHRDLAMGAALRTVEELRARGLPTTLTDVLLRATAEALDVHPELNCHFNEGDIVRFKHPAIALAADSPAGVVAPVIRISATTSWASVARERRRVVEGARNGRLMPADLTGGTFSISNVGPLGGDLVVPMVTPPQVAILGLGRVRPGAGNMVATGVLSADHRVLDGADAARFLRTLDEVLARSSATTEEPRHAAAEEEGA
ncbi:2-oxo acid dehydrogenase subunit E2 [Nocardioides cavernae]|uniref:Dihydrolipoamide acetyltransferase component of pyruvate dehydrogenase complex n=1 Tax=Nocardioides cavernae TaxID=1921566 RepID=A0ABR8NAR3_9ACTN|nr:2-oxo acid dehydrogenase subunit E2 [Nocardioides cavernae]MBD3924270.1 2-oxo acid dehydrogenase subunit E2 [Nocardioides cavernae]MBM7510791.1 pyruvate dehydrogenase E2 component (dihydrolipoamide acetyltransferase) [Nocardioides cavernae]